MKDPYADMQRFVRSENPLIFDVGANVGQTAETFRKRFKTAEIHCFEPGKEPFRELKTKADKMAGVKTVNSALGARREVRTFNENDVSVMSSFLDLGKDGWGSVARRVEVEVDTVDEYCGRAAIPHIDILKSDTQGYDLEVLRGANEMLAAGKIDLVYLELTFSDMYKGLPRFDEIHRFL